MANTTAPSANTGGPYLYRIGSSLFLDASGSTDVYGDPLTFAWDLNNDFVFGDVAGIKPTLTDALQLQYFPKPGDYPISVQVTDALSGLSSVAFTTVLVTAASPNASTGGPYGYRIGAPFTLDASGSTDIYNNPLTYSWDLNNDGVFGDVTGIKPSFTDALQTKYFNALGDYPIAVRVTDTAYNLSSVAYTTVITTASSPIANVGGPYLARAGTPFVLDASGSTDIYGSPLTYSWDLNNDGGFGDVFGIKPNISASQEAQYFGGPGTYPIAVRVTDPLYDLSSTAFSVVIIRAAPIPEPSSNALLLAGCLGIGLRFCRAKFRSA